MATQRIKPATIANSKKNLFWKQLILPPIILAVTTIICYFSSLYYDFQFDDIANIKKLFDIRNNTFAKQFFTGTRWISYWVNSIYYSFSRFDAFIYRVGNVLLHTTTGIVVFFLTYKLLECIKEENFFTRNKLIISCVTAGLFLLHPVQSQTVSYVIQGQLEGSASFFVFSIILCFIYFVQAQTPLASYSLGTLLFCLAALSCGTKEIAILSPILAVVVDWFFLAQGDLAELKKRWRIHAALFVVVWGIYMIFLKPSFFAKLIGLQHETRNNIGNVLTEDPTSKIYPIPFFISQFKVILHYLHIFVWPFNISVEYDWKMSTSFFAPDCIIPFLVLITFFAYLGYRLKQNSRDIIAFAFIWFFISIAPRCTIIPSSELMTDYKTYLGSFAVLFLLACVLIKAIEWGLAYLSRIVRFQNSHSIAYAMISVCLLLTGYATHERNKVWRSGLEFWGNIIENAPGKARAYNNYAVALSEMRQYNESIPFYIRAAEMDTRYADPLNNLAVCYSVIGKIDMAIEALKQSIAIQPYYPEAYNNLASFFIQKKEYDKAAKMLDLALKLRSHYGKALFNYGKLYMDQNQHEKAHEYFKKACTEADLDNEAGFGVYAQLSVHLKKYDDAIIAYKMLCEFNPQSPQYPVELARIYALKGDKKQAQTLLTKLTQKQPQNGHAWFQLGEVFYTAADFTKAVDCYAQAEKNGLSHPMLYAHLSECYEKLNQPEQARTLLAKMSTMQGIPDDIRQLAQTKLAQLKA